MQPHELMIDPASDRELDDQASAILDANADYVSRRRAEKAEYKLLERQRKADLIAELLALAPTTGELAALARRYGSWGEVTAEVQVSIPVVAAAYLKAGGSASDLIVSGLGVKASGVPAEFVDLLAQVPGRSGWKAVDGEEHWANAYRAIVNYQAINHPAADVHPLILAAWSLLACAFVELEAEGAGR